MIWLEYRLVAAIQGVLQKYCIICSGVTVIVSDFQMLKSIWRINWQEVSWPAEVFTFVIPWQIKQIKGLVLNLHLVAVHQNSQYEVQKDVQKREAIIRWKNHRPHKDSKTFGD